MKVAFFAATMLPEEGGGHVLSEDVLRALQQHESESTHQFQVYARRGPAALTSRSALRRVMTSDAQRPVPAWLRVIYPERLRNTHGRWTSSRWTRRLARDGVDILWSALPEVPTLDVPFVVPVWDLEHRQQPFFPELSLRGEWNRREALFTTMLRRAALVITGTSAGADQIQFFYRVPTSRIKILPHPTPEFARAAIATNVDVVLQAHGIQRPYVFYPAQFWPHKNHVGVLRAVKEACQRTGTRIAAVFAGGDLGNADHVRAVARQLGIESDVHILGFVDRTTLAALYRGALALTYLSFGGPENLPPLEAFALGCPVIAADVPGAGEQLGSAALLVHPTDECAAGHAIARLLNDPQARTELVTAGCGRADRFTAVDYVRGVFQLLDEFEKLRRSWP